MAASNDFIRMLPLETTIHILSFLDSRSLFACSCLSRTWYDALNFLCPEIWFEACLRAGIYVSRDKYSDVREWKSFLRKMVARNVELFDGTGFHVFVNFIGDRIKAIYNHRDKIAIAYSDRIDVRNRLDNEYFVTLRCNFEPSSVKFDDSIVIAASEDGRMSSWSLTNEENLGEYASDDGSVTSFDFLTDCDTIACSFNSKFIRVWSISKVGVTARVRPDHLTPIVKVLLVPDPNHSESDERKRSLLFSLTVQNVVLSNVELRYSAVTSGYSFSVETASSFSFDTPVPSLCILPTDVFPDNRGGLLYDGDYLYILPPIATRISRVFFKWGLRTQERLCIILNTHIIDLLGIGEKYLIYRERLDSENEYVVAADKIGLQTIASMDAPRRMNLFHLERNIFYLEDDCMCLGDTAWLDGLNGENDRGNVYMCIAEDKLSLCISNFIPRTE